MALHHNAGALFFLFALGTSLRTDGALDATTHAHQALLAAKHLRSLIHDKVGAIRQSLVEPLDVLETVHNEIEDGFQRALGGYGINDPAVLVVPKPVGDFGRDEVLMVPTSPMGPMPESMWVVPVVHRMVDGFADEGLADGFADNWLTDGGFADGFASDFAPTVVAVPRNVTSKSYASETIQGTDGKIKRKVTKCVDGKCSSQETLAEPKKRGAASFAVPLKADKGPINKLATSSTMHRSKETKRIAKDNARANQDLAHFRALSGAIHSVADKIRRMRDFFGDDGLQGSVDSLFKDAGLHTPWGGKEQAARGKPLSQQPQILRMRSEITMQPDGTIKRIVTKCQDNKCVEDVASAVPRKAGAGHKTASTKHSNASIGAQEEDAKKTLARMRHALGHQTHDEEQLPMPNNGLDDSSDHASAGQGAGDDIILASTTSKKSLKSHSKGSLPSTASKHRSQAHLKRTVKKG